MIRRADKKWNLHHHHQLIVSYSIKGMSIDDIAAFNSDLRHQIERLIMQHRRQQLHGVEVTGIDKS